MDLLTEAHRSGAHPPSVGVVHRSASTARRIGVPAPGGSAALVAARNLPGRLLWTLRDGWTTTRRALGHLRHDPGQLIGAVTFPGVMGSAVGMLIMAVIGLLVGWRAHHGNPTVLGRQLSTGSYRPLELLFGWR
jgi:hypothetical protein